jgi:hypothetical protein
MNNEGGQGLCSIQIVRLGEQWRLITLSILHSTLFIFHYLFIQAQTPTQEQLTGTWIGVHSEWDTDFFCPLPTYLQLDTDGTYQLGMVDNSAQPLPSTWAIQGDSVRLDTIHYAPRLVTVQGNLLRIGATYPMVFRRFTSIPIDSASAYRQLNGCVWQSDSLLISLYANGRASLENRTNQQRTAHFWRLASFGKALFLIIRGNQYDRDSDYTPLRQISSVSPEQMQAVGWNGHSVATETFRFVRKLAPGDSCRPSGFQTCDNCFRRMWYERSLVHSTKRYELSQLLAKYYRPVSLIGQSGLVRVEFVVNCQGEFGRINLSGYDEAYCPKPFDTSITNQLLAICREHIATDPALRLADNPTARPRDVAISLTFRLKDGQLLDILP